MDNKSFQYSADFTTRAAATSNNTHSHNYKDHEYYLRQLNELSHNISKPNNITKKFTFDPSKNRTFNYKPYLTHPQLQPPPPVYHVTKNEFKDVVQKLTGKNSPSHSHHPISMPPPPIQKPKPPSSRLQRIRPPPLAQISNRQPLVLNGATTAVPSSNPVVNVNDVVAPQLSPLPPLPSVRVAAESPITAYMRFLNNSVPSMGDPMLSPSILFSPSSAELMGFPELNVPSPAGNGWNGL